MAVAVPFKIEYRRCHSAVRRCGQRRTACARRCDACKVCRIFVAVAVVDTHRVVIVVQIGISNAVFGIVAVGFGDGVRFAVRHSSQVAFFLVEVCRVEALGHCVDGVAHAFDARPCQCASRAAQVAYATRARRGHPRAYWLQRLVAEHVVAQIGRQVDILAVVFLCLVFQIFPTEVNHTACVLFVVAAADLYLVVEFFNRSGVVEVRRQALADVAMTVEFFYHAMPPRSDGSEIARCADVPVDLRRDKVD